MASIFACPQFPSASGTHRQGVCVFAATLAFWILSSTSLVFAQTVELPPVSVEVTSPTTVATPADQIANSVTVITGAELERDQRRTVPDALSTVPGLNVVQSGGPGSLTSVFMRGTDSRHTKILVDGIDVSDPSTVTRVFDLGQLLTADVDRIEVLRGPQSGLYGADALGGVISIVTKAGSGPAKASGTVEAGSFGTFNQTARLSGSEAQFNYAFNFAHFRTDSTPVTPLELLPPGRQRIDDFYDNRTYSTKLGAELNDNFGVNFVGRYTDATFRNTGEDFTFFPSVPAAAQSEQIARQLFTRGEVTWSPFERFKNYFGVNYTNHITSRFSPDTGFGSFLSIDRGERIKFDWRSVTSLLPGQTLVTGLENETERFRTDTGTPENGNRAAYVELQSELEKRFFLVSNIRIDSNDRFGDHTTYRLAPAFIVPVTETKLKGSYGTGFKAPTLFQLFASFPPTFFGNPALQPEKSKGYDFGFEQPLADNRVRFGATYFHNDITGFINPTTVGFDFSFGFPIPVQEYTNVDQFTSSGVEAFGTVQITPQLGLRGDYTYTQVNAEKEFALLRKPRHKASLTAVWTPIESLSISSTLLFVSSWRDLLRGDTTQFVDQPGYTVVNVAANYTVNENATLFGRVDNLFNEQYQDPNGFDRPGVGVFAGLRLTH